MIGLGLLAGLVAVTGLAVAQQDSRSYRDKRVRAVFTMAPALGPTFLPESLERIDIPVMIVAGATDAIAPVRSSAQSYAARIPACRADNLSRRFRRLCLCRGLQTGRTRHLFGAAAKPIRSPILPAISGPTIAPSPNSTRRCAPTATPWPSPRATKSTRRTMCGTTPTAFNPYTTQSATNPGGGPAMRVATAASRWDKPFREADTLDALEKLLTYQPPPRTTSPDRAAVFAPLRPSALSSEAGHRRSVFPAAAETEEFSVRSWFDPAPSDALSHAAFRSGACINAQF